MDASPPSVINDINSEKKIELPSTTSSVSKGLPG
jgi:hypothetical protein